MKREIYDKFLQDEALLLKELIFALTKQCVEIGDLKGFIEQCIINFLVERKENAPGILEIIPDFSADDFASLLSGEIQIGDRITIQTPQYLIVSIVEEVRIVSDLKQTYKH